MVKKRDSDSPPKHYQPRKGESVGEGHNITSREKAACRGGAIKQNKKKKKRRRTESKPGRFIRCLEGGGPNTL